MHGSNTLGLTQYKNAILLHGYLAFYFVIA